MSQPCPRSPFSVPVCALSDPLSLPQLHSLCHSSAEAHRHTPLCRKETSRKGFSKPKWYMGLHVKAVNLCFKTCKIHRQEEFLVLGQQALIEQKILNIIFNISQWKEKKSLNKPIKCLGECDHFSLPNLPGTSLSRTWTFRCCLLPRGSCPHTKHWPLSS